MILHVIEFCRFEMTFGHVKYAFHPPDSLERSTDPPHDDAKGYVKEGVHTEHSCQIRGGDVWEMANFRTASGPVCVCRGNRFPQGTPKTGVGTRCPSFRGQTTSRRLSERRLGGVHVDDQVNGGRGAL